GRDVLEVGAGHGSLTARFAGDGRHVVATDLSVRCVDALRERFAGRPDVEVLLGDVMDQPVQPVFDSVVLVNVLEHLSDDLGALRRLSGTLRPGGHVVVFVPAFEGLYSDFDRRVGHMRRYRRAELLTPFAEAGLEPVEGKYVNTVGALAWWLVVRQLGIVPTTRGLLRVYDRAAVPELRLLERGRRPPFGQSLFVAGRVAERVAERPV
ncbi:MAG: class I SAM-dependent methyltransferase, partial [Acidimicrobiia bacterium]